ncbi:protein AGENET DOMAIN (AGD)-CONTAINING P1-like [Macadamia integrifolia]|uniref:protein AGENET DOMAIN (AGD)-CONTAINING P1-like n=1 Tax=Macadamia integrifolia TaxID=60698 RepID=UPI001C4FF234|nr:protein AGENET DOMAIN (AGD)-CONTAINING P1-like [Macadamia integrifolia]
MAFAVGDSLEVCGLDAGFEGSYYITTVFSVEDQSVLVEYASLLTDDASGCLQEMVHHSHLKPHPPHLTPSEFRLDDVVDAYDNDGWWVDKITMIEQSRSYVTFNGDGQKTGDRDNYSNDEVSVVYNYRYFVLFPCGDEIALPCTSLRIHQEWRDSNWVH